MSFVDLKTANCIDSLNPELTLMDVSVPCTSCLLAADGFLQILRGAAAWLSSCLPFRGRVLLLDNLTLSNLAEQTNPTIVSFASLREFFTSCQDISPRVGGGIVAGR